MEKEEIVYLASKAFNKRWDYETLLYSDDLYSHPNKRELADQIWEYVTEIEEEGFRVFSDKYGKQCKLYY